MRRVAVIAHVRGNKAALDAVLGSIDELQPPADQVVVTGDYDGGGPHSKRVARALDKRALLPPPAVEGALGDYLINPGNAGQPASGDPRATFAILNVDSDAVASVEHIRVPYALKKTERAMLNKIDRGKIDPKSGLAYLRRLLGEEALVHKDPPLTGELSGTDLAINLLGTRVFRVYGLGSLDWPEDQVEYVHDLRVATRRLREALSLAAPILKPKRVEKANLRARKLGRVLGERRIFDVFLEEVKTIAGEHRLDLASFLTFLEARRDKATIEVHVEFSKRKLIRHGLKLLELAMWPIDQETPLRALAPPHLETRARDVEERLDSVVDERAHDEHHELRIKLKHLRYSAEILRSAWPELIDPEKTVVPVKAMQDVLGELNDARELVALAEEHGHGEDAALRRFCEILEGQRAERHTRARAEVAISAPLVIQEMRAIAQAIRDGA